MFNVLLTRNSKKRILNKFEMTHVKFIIIVFLFEKPTYMDRRPCMCLSYGTFKAGGAGGNEGVRMVPRRVKWMLPRRD